MDKQIIEEMARIIAFDLCPNRHVHAKWGEEAQCYSDNNFAECTKIKNVVDKLYNAGYRKADDLLKELQSMKSDFAKDMLEIKETYEKEVVDLVNEVRKETAEKLLDEIDYESNGQTKSITDLLRKKYGV